MCSFPGAYFCIKACSETDQTENLKRIDVPTLVPHRDDDQTLPIEASAMQSSKMIKRAKLVVHNSAPHGMCTTLKDKINDDLLAFIKS